jgi:hypothetical protein
MKKCATLFNGANTQSVDSNNLNAWIWISQHVAPPTNRLLGIKPVVSIHYYLEVVSHRFCDYHDRTISHYWYPLKNVVGRELPGFLLPRPSNLDNLWLVQTSEYLVASQYNFQSHSATGTREDVKAGEGGDWSKRLLGILFTDPSCQVFNVLLRDWVVLYRGIDLLGTIWMYWLFQGINLIQRIQGPPQVTATSGHHFQAVVTGKIDKEVIQWPWGTL